jgi:endonuclease YncB( thermonuclease family)
MRRAVLPVAALGLGGAVALVFAMAPVREPVPDIEEQAVSVPVEEASAAPAVPVKTGRVRAIAPDAIAQPQLAPDELVRIEPRQPLSTFVAPTRKNKNHGRVFRPFIQSAGEFAGSGVAITLAGIVPTGAEHFCKDAGGAEWPCGARARAAFRAFVRGRALLCDLPEEITQKSYTVACALGKQDVAGWLVAQGWAEALPGSAYAAAGEAARAAGKGIYGAAPVIEALPDPEPFVSALPEPLAQPFVAD